MLIKSFKVYVQHMDIYPVDWDPVKNYQVCQEMSLTLGAK